MAKGGKQPGAGRPKGTLSPKNLEIAKAREYLTQRVVSELEPMISSHIELAKGIWMEELDPTTGERRRVYKKAPDTRAAEYLVDQAIGKASQAIDVTSKGEQIVTASPEAIKLAKEYEEKLKKGL